MIVSWRRTPEIRDSKFGWIKNAIIFVKDTNQNNLQTVKFQFVAYENNDRKQQDSIYSKRIRAGKRRTYFFDVRSTRGNDYYLTITESRKRFNDNGYDRHKVFLYKEDFNKFIKALTEAIDYVKTDLMPDFDFDAFNHEDAGDDHDYDGEDVQFVVPAPVVSADIAAPSAITTVETPTASNASDEVDKW